MRLREEAEKRAHDEAERRKKEKRAKAEAEQRAKVTIWPWLFHRWPSHARGQYFVPAVSHVFGLVMRCMCHACGTVLDVIGVYGCRTKQSGVGGSRKRRREHVTR